RFLRDGPRVWWLWDQNEHAMGGRPTREYGPSQKADFRYGRQLSRSELAYALDKAGGDEDAAYRMARVSGLRRRATHGAHVMDLLSGAGHEAIVVVQFPESGIDASSR